MLKRKSTFQNPDVTVEHCRTSAADSGLYFCIGKTNEALSAPGFLHLTVLAKDEAITEAPSNVTAVAGDDVALTCRTHLELHR